MLAPVGTDIKRNSLIETAEACGLEPYRYLRLLFERMPFCQNETELKALLPQSMTPEKKDVIRRKKTK